MSDFIHATRTLFATGVLTCLLAAPSPGIAQEAEDPDAGPNPARRSYRAAPIEGASPTVDGRLDERVWRDATFTSNLTQREPDEGAAASRPARIAVRFTENDLYLAARMEREDPSTIRRQVTRRDEAGTSAALYVHLDPERDRRTAKVFGVTAAGVRVDYFLPSDGQGGRDETFDPVWDAAVSVDSAGWTVEARIPFSELRLSGTPRTTWGFQVEREMPSRNEVDHWVLVPRTRQGWASRFGTLEGLEGIDRSLPVEARPYAAVRGDVRAEVSGQNPLRSETASEVRVGGELTAGLGSGLTLDATVNPDFGQVQADPARLNLSAFETFFREHRPFFTEGSQYLSGDGPRYFYSRRIGAAPHGRASGQFVEAPRNTTILGAGKLTGRVAGDLSVGALAAVTQRERARVVADSGSEVTTETVEPATGYGVARLEEQLSGGSTVGLSLTGVHRQLRPEGSLADMLPETAVTGGGDWNLQFDDGTYALTGHGGFSYVTGSRASMQRLQRSSVRFFQRPDQDHVSVDSSRTSLAGWSGGLQLEKRSGEHWLWNVDVEAESPGFAINDAGRLRSTDHLSAGGELAYRETDPGPLFRRWRLELGTNTDWNFGGTRRFTSLSPEVTVEWPNFMRTNLRYSHVLGGTADRRTRGGPEMDRTDSWRVRVRHATNPREPNRLDLMAGYGRAGLGGWTALVGLGASARPSPDLRLQFNPRFVVGEEPRQYVTSMDGGPDATFGRRYVFGRLDRSTLSGELRADYAFSPDLSLELYAQPFAAAGDYHDLGELRSAGDRQLLRYGEGDSRILERRDRSLLVEVDGREISVPAPDFSRFSFRSTAVLRWEWSPGSTLFLAWQQNRSERQATGETVAPGDWLEPFGGPGDQAVTAKMSYWLRF